MAALQEAIQTAEREGQTPFFVGATAGTTVTGAFDPLEPLAQVSSRPVTMYLKEHATSKTQSLCHEPAESGMALLSAHNWNLLPKLADDCRLHAFRCAGSMDCGSMWMRPGEELCC